MYHKIYCKTASQSANKCEKAIKKGQDDYIRLQTLLPQKIKRLSFRSARNYYLALFITSSNKRERQRQQAKKVEIANVFTKELKEVKVLELKSRVA